ncbi:hypothetical protein SD70_13675 [Gordoniibacillus kamchatkensis]|uniref:Rod shape-determining protein MreD n=2 Tax=Gordoniibacillus kamchatkensis TaxID=1590651 RepID=A0ABR5AHE9_9BACL|nr:hypothetical protein SD70_13675 [Paenibacillus sp. VKM B-2647]
MFLNVLFGFVLPWIIGGTYLLKKGRKILILIFPFSSMLAFTINQFGFHFGLWSLMPRMNKSFSALPFDLGLYPIQACLMIIAITNFPRIRCNPYWFIVANAFLVTFAEWVYLKFGMVVYGHGWNIIGTFVSYLVPLVLVYLYFNLIKQYVN